MSGVSRPPRLVALALTVLLVAITVGCGGQQAAPAPPTQPAQKPAAPAAAPAPAPAPAKQTPQPTAAAAAEFYKGKTVNFIIPYGPGGGFDQYARLVAPYLERSLGVTVVPLNKPGAGGLIGANELFAGKNDGLSLGILNVPGMVFNEVMGEPNAKFQLGKFTWLARVTAEPRILVASKKSGLKKIGEFATAGRPLKFSVTGKGSDDYFTAAIVGKAFNFPINYITGYEGSKQAELAVARGEVDFTLSNPSSVLPLIQQGDAIPVLLFANEPDPLTPGVDLAMQVVRPEGKPLLAVIFSIMQLDRTLAAAPGIPADRVKVMRDALDKAFNDPDLRAKAAAAKRPLNFLHGDQVAELVSTVARGVATVKPVLEESMKAAK